MRKIIFLLLLITVTSCLNNDDLDINKFDNLIIEPEVLLPFIQVDFSDKFYNEIYDVQDKTTKQIDIDSIDVFENNDISENVKQIDFNFTPINGFPIKFNEISVNFLDVNGINLEKITLNNIGSGTINPDGSLKEPWMEKEFKESFDSTKFAKLMDTRSIRVIFNWEGPFPKPDSSFYFKMNSDLILKTNIDTNK